MSQPKEVVLAVPPVSTGILTSSYTNTDMNTYADTYTNTNICAHTSTYTSTETETNTVTSSEIITNAQLDKSTDDIIDATIGISQNHAHMNTNKRTLIDTDTYTQTNPDIQINESEHIHVSTNAIMYAPSLGADMSVKIGANVHTAVVFSNAVGDVRGGTRPLAPRQLHSGVKARNLMLVCMYVCHVMCVCM